MPRRSDHRYWLYEHKYDSEGAFLDYVSGLVRETGIRINILLVVCKTDIESELKSWSPEKFSVNFKNSLPVFTIEIDKEFEIRETIKVKAVVLKYDETLPVYMVVSDCSASDFKTVITKLVNKHYPEVSRIFLTNNEMRWIFERLERSTKSEIQVDSSIGKKRIPGMVKKKESQVTYTNLPYAEVFDEIVAGDRWVQSIKFTASHVSRTKTEVIREYAYSGIVARDCFFSCQGTFQPFLESVLPQATRFAKARVEYLRKRAESAANPKPEPVVIKFPEELFANPSKNKQYIDAIADLESCSISEYHTNPYIHISILDYLDGSSYDLWVTSSDRIVIIPHFSASTASMARLVNHIYERVHEGEHEEYADIFATR